MAGFMQCMEVIDRYRWWVGGVIFLMIVLSWWLRVVSARKNKTYTATLRKKYAVLVVAEDEDPEVFESCLASIKEHSKPTQLLVSINDTSHAHQSLRAIAKEYATTVVEQPEMMSYDAQLASLIEKVRRVSLVVVTTPRAHWTPSTINLLLPFAEPTIGLVSGRQQYTGGATLSQRIGSWLLDMQQRVILPMQSRHGQAYAITSDTFAIRLELLKQFTQSDATAQPCAAHHPSSIALSLSAQYHAAYQHSALTQINHPVELYRIASSYTQLSRAAYWQLWHQHARIRRAGPLVWLTHSGFCFASLLYLGALIVLCSTLVNNLYSTLTGTATTATLWSSVTILGLVLGWLVWQAVRNIPHLKHHPRDLWLLPLYLPIAGSLALTSKLWALITLSRHHAPAPSSALRQYATGLAAIVLLLITVPLAYVVAMIPAQQPQEAPHRPAQTAPRPQQQRDKRGKTDKKQANRPATTSGQSQAQHTPAHSEKKNQTTTSEQKPIILTAQDGDSQSLVARRFIKSHHQAQQLNPAQAAYAENRLVALMGQRDDIDSGETFTVSASQLAAVITEARALSADEQANWAAYTTSE